jgi:GT2 family glycosyltransferase
MAASPARATARAIPVQASPKVAVVVLNWNDGAATLACLDALQATDYQNRTVIVVDNGSSDGSAQRIRDRGLAEFVANPTNLGYTGGVNTGIGRALAGGADYVWLLNSDALPRPDALSRLVAAAEKDEQIGLVSPVSHDPDHPESAEFCLGRFDPVARCVSQTADPAIARSWQEGHPHEVALPGTALLIKRRLIEEIGMLDPVFFAYVEDVDYYIRARKAGFRSIAIPDAVVLHKFKRPVANPGGVPAYLHYFMTRNYLLLWRKLPRPILLRKAALWFLVQRLSQIQRMRDLPTAVDAVLAGLYDGFRGVGGPYQPERKPPLLLRATFGDHPAFWRALIDGSNPFRR